MKSIKCILTVRFLFWQRDDQKVSSMTIHLYLKIPICKREYSYVSAMARTEFIYLQPGNYLENILYIFASIVSTRHRGNNSSKFFFLESSPYDKGAKHFMLDDLS